MSKPDAPTPPNPYQTAAAQTGTNVSTGVANSFLNNINQNTPEGSLRYDVTGNYGWTDPSTGHNYNIPRFTSTQTLSPQQEQLRNTNAQTQQNLANMGQEQSSKVSGLLSQPFNPGSGGPEAGRMDWLHSVGNPLGGYDAGGDIQRTFGDAGQIHGQDDFSADRQRVEDALMSRMNPQLARERGNIEQRLADQGIRYGSQAYTSAMDDYNRQATDTRFGAIDQAGQEQARMVGMSQAAQQQMYDQLMGRGTFANQAQAQQNAQNAGAAGFYNAGLAQNMQRNQSIFNAANASRNQYLQEQYQQRNQPLNEISALMSGSQVQQPNWLNSPNSQIPTTDFAGIMNQNMAQQQANYQTAMQGWNSTMGGLLGLGGKLGGTAIMSDRRVKDDIDRIGTVFAATTKGDRKKLPIYEYSYKDDPASSRHTGPMAQDVEKIEPKAVVRDRKGIRYIKNDEVMSSILRAA